MIELVAAAFAIVGGFYGAYVWLSRAIRSRPFKKPLDIFAGTDELKDALLKLNGKTVNFDTVIDFSIGGVISSRIAEETEYGELLSKDASFLNGRRLPLYVLTAQNSLDSFASLVVEMKQARRLKFSHGGTGITQVLLKGRFDVEVRAYSGPSVEITLREV